MLNKYPVLIFFLLVLVSCDPAKIIVLKTNKVPNSQISIYADATILPYSNPDSISKIILQVPYTDSTTHREKVLNYGLGVWDDEELIHLSEIIDSIIIQNAESIDICNSQNEIHAYLIAHRGGFAGSRLLFETE